MVISAVLRPQTRKETNSVLVAQLDTDRGAVTLEFLFVAFLILVPLLYITLVFFEAQRGIFAVTQAAREAGRALATADDLGQAESRARRAMSMTLQDQGVDPSRAELLVAPAGSGCSQKASSVALRPGDHVEVCVVYTLITAGVPGFLENQRNTITGRFVVPIDQFRSAR